MDNEPLEVFGVFDRLKEQLGSITEEPQTEYFFHEKKVKSLEELLVKASAEQEVIDERDDNCAVRRK